MYLVAADTSGIQTYIFGSNRLRENIGASHLVKQATGAWALNAVKAAAKLQVGPDENNLAKQLPIEKGAAAEVIYSGGGNVVVLFKDEDTAKAYMRTLSQQVLCEAPGLSLLLALSDEFDWKLDMLTHVQQSTFEKLSLLKRNRQHSTPPLSLGVTLPCQSTGLPAVAYAGSDADPANQYPVSADVLAKHDALNDANKALRQELEDAMGDASRYYAFPYDLDNLGREAGDNSFIAVIHADGNGIGKRVLQLAEKFDTPDKNRAYVDKMREFSKRMNDCAGKALQATLHTLVERVVQADLPGESDRYEKLVHLNSKGDKLATVTLKQVDRALYPNVSQNYFLPFRPIVFGGDDVTFVCDGRLGVSLAIEYLNNFEACAKDPQIGLLDWDALTKQFVVKGATAAAGIAIVKTHYPFARAYGLAEDLCDDAKKLRTHFRDKSENWEGSTLDWHYALSGLFGGIGEIRDREYTVPAGSLTLRPVALSDNVPDARRTWSVVEKGLTAFQSDWINQRNKSKALRDALRGGPDAIKTFCEKYLRDKASSRQLPDVGGLPNSLSWRESGWTTARHDPDCEKHYSGYFDALELMDLYIPIHAASNPSSQPKPQTQAQEAKTYAQ